MPIQAEIDDVSAEFDAAQREYDRYGNVVICVNRQLSVPVILDATVMESTRVVLFAISSKEEWDKRFKDGMKMNPSTVAVENGLPYFYLGMAE